MQNEISTETLTEKAHGVAGVEAYRGYEIVDKESYVVICRNAAVVQCAHTPEQARQNIDEIIAERDARFQANLKKMGRRDNNPNDLI
jgi:hypothetical protein